MKPKRQMNFRIEPDEWAQFCQAADTAGVSAAQVLRDLIKASVVYMGQYKRWWPPVLSPEIPVAPVQLRMVAEPGQRYGTVAPVVAAGVKTDHAKRK